MIRFAAISAGALLAATTAFADPETAAQLRDKALHDATAYDVLESLTTEIGSRIVGSPAAKRAGDWGVAKMKALGFKNVHIEPFAKQAWHRGEESAEVISPFPQKLWVLGLGDSASTPPEGIEGEVVVLKSVAALAAAPADAFKGKIVVVNQPMVRTQDGMGYGTGVMARYATSQAAKRGAIAYLTRSISTATNRTPHTGMTAQMPGVPKIPAGALGVPDADLLEHMAARGPVRIHLTLVSEHVDGQGYTVSGDIVGSEKPNEVIVIGGHLDSWDPGTGAIDDGAGVAITTAAAHLIGELPHHPRRTIRVVMWGSEEQGGANDAYLAAHKNDLANIVIAGESDLGADNVYQLLLPAGAMQEVELQSLSATLAPIKVLVSPMPATEAGEDVSSIQKAGVPVFSLSQDATRYFDYHHSADDTLAIVDPAQLDQNVAAWATVLYTLANSDVDFRHLPPAKPFEFP
jgi:Zn-dependent M28 family amino/carboxypeptidase